MAGICHRSARVTILTDASVLQPSIFLSPSGGFRISIPSTRAAARIQSNPLTTDSLQIYADQIGRSFSQIDQELDNDTFTTPQQPYIHETVPYHTPESHSCLEKDLQKAPQMLKSIHEHFPYQETLGNKIEDQKVRSEHPVIRLKFQGHELPMSSQSTISRSTMNNVTLMNGDDLEELKCNTSTLTVLPHRIYLNRGAPSIDVNDCDDSDSMSTSLPQIYVPASAITHNGSSDNSLASSCSRKKILVTSTASSESLCNCSNAFWTWNMHAAHQSISPPPSSHQHNHMVYYDTGSSVFRGEHEKDGNEESLSTADLPCIHTYQFTTLDRELLNWLHIQVKEVREHKMNVPSTSSLEELALIEEKDEQQLKYFQRHMPEYGFERDELDDSIWCTARIYINLIKPIKISLRKAGISLTELNDLNLSQSMILELLDNLAMFLPRGTCKQVYLHIDTTVQEVIAALLEHLYIKDSWHKFALYEHCLENEHTIIVTRLSNDTAILRHIFTWAHADGDIMRANVNKRRLVLQENESTDIEWTDFSLPELYNFIRILDKEKTQYEHGLKLHYGLRRQYICDLMKQRKQFRS